MRYVRYLAERIAERLRKNALCWVLIALMPASAVSADVEGKTTAFARVYGNVSLNGEKAPDYLPLFSGDSVQTEADSMVRIDSVGTSVTVQQRSLVTFEGNSVSVGKGTVEMNTSRKMTAQAGDVMVVPAQNVRTEFEVARLNGVIQVTARKGDLALRSGSETTTLVEGERATEDESSSGAIGSPTQGARGKFLKKRYLIGAAVATGAALGIWAIVDATSGSSNSVSPTTP